MSGVSYGAGIDSQGEYDGMWWVRAPAEVGFAIEWFNTQKRARCRYDELLSKSKGGE